MRRTWGQLALLALALLGAGIAIYLTFVHYQQVALVCSSQGFVDCARVLSSPYSNVPGTTIPITFPGLAWIVASAVLAVVVWRFPEQRNLLLLQCVWMGLGLLAVFYLVYVELVRLHTLCAWCTGFHVIILVMLLLSILQLQNGESSEDERDEEDVEETPKPVSMPRQ